MRLMRNDHDPGIDLSELKTSLLVFEFLVKETRDENMLRINPELKDSVYCYLLLYFTVNYRGVKIRVCLI